jgi:hypothetical protein
VLTSVKVDRQQWRAIGSALAIDGGLMSSALAIGGCGRKELVGRSYVYLPAPSCVTCALWQVCPLLLMICKTVCELAVQDAHEIRGIICCRNDGPESLSPTPLSYIASKQFHAISQYEREPFAHEFRPSSY